MAKFVNFLAGLVAAAIVCGCSNGQSAAASASAENDAPVKLGSFSADSAYQYIADQVACGPRVPGSEGHAKCVDYIIDRFKAFRADSLIVQRGEAEAFNGDRLPVTNIIAGYNIENPRRILLVAHYDTRPWADRDKNEANRHLPIDGANDGASGVGVLLEVARNLAIKRPNVGVDILFVDAEDYGDSSGFNGNDESWCLGSRYWAANMTPYTADNLPVYGILLDMVGGRNAHFHYEMFSQRDARVPTVKVWSEAEQLGHGDKFIRSIGGAVTDDHVVLTAAGIPTTDIIETVNEVSASFPPTWHTMDDNMSNIDRSSLKAVGETVLNVVYKEKGN